MDKKWVCLMRRAADPAPEPMRLCSLFAEKFQALAHARENPGHIVFVVLRVEP